MRLLKSQFTRFALYSLIAAAALGMAACGGSSSSSSASTNPAPNTTANTQAIEVNSGPANNYTNGIFTTVTICVPGTTNCQAIPNVLVDTGSEGLRLLSSAVTLTLPTVDDNSNNVLQECVSFADGSYMWGPVAEADIQMAGEVGSSVPIQLVSASPTFNAPNSCVNGGAADDNVATLGANGILGIGNFEQDCGAACTSTTTLPNPPPYWLCPNSVCQATTVPLNYQLLNPVWTFPQDNNGVLISLPSIPDTGASSVSGSLIFGIGTQSDNALGNAQVYTTDTSGNFQTTYNGIAYGQSYIDSGSDALYFMDSTTLGIPDCSSFPGWYCPGSSSSLSPVDFTVTNTGLNGTSGPVTFSIANPDFLFSSNNNGGQNWAFNNLGGDSGTSQATDYFDFGLPFFYGRNVFVGIENQTGPNGVVGPYWAY